MALSRATETLAVVNVEPDARKDLSTLALVGGAGRYNQDDIIARFGDETATPEERTSERIRRAEATRTGPGRSPARRSPKWERRTCRTGCPTAACAATRARR